MSCVRRGWRVRLLGLPATTGLEQGNLCLLGAFVVQRSAGTL